MENRSLFYYNYQNNKGDEILNLHPLPIIYQFLTYKSSVKWIKNWPFDILRRKGTMSYHKYIYIYMSSYNGLRMVAMSTAINGNYSE